ncbi:MULTISPECIES: ABC transporter permease [Pedobacter]|uniref:ABC-2 type transporter n=1 Tax=Pedobacter heparinus (strain ATCC 13125 / DSM 2366 / CIP 104194 / JCM 7457 / NBRC 12017 / NCIMB 9290 / NRRL B-14731 / HIM 762-3) TaxID=485917 RepID=C6XW55_PEDHD|nr:MULTISPECIES: ABC transporter permease [Pedobacter]ACU04134.1 ABC-2 type transporter [Pedobacter heparinus DSM 2366]MBB5436414.1 ABC-2 type transport system permease protein [Pedobacter sp. AK017]
MQAMGHIILREWKRILRLPVFYIVMLVIPGLLFSFYALIYQQRDARNLAFAIWDEDQSPLSRQLIFLLQQRETLQITRRVGTEAEVKQLIQNGVILGAVHFPANMQKDIYSRHQAHVTLYTNAASLVPAKLIYKAVAEVVIMGSSGVVLQKLVKTGMKADRAMALANPVKLNSYQLYNASYNYQEYLVPGLITVGIQMILIISSMLALNYEWKTNTMQELYGLAKGSALLVITAKTIAHLVFSWVNFILIAFVLFPWFGIGVPVATGKFFLMYTLLSVACIGIGMFISALFKDVMLSGDVALFYTSPAFVFSGFTFPRWAMPWYDQYYATIMPYTPFLDAFFKVYYMNLPMHYAQADINKLVLFCAVMFPTAILLFQHQFNSSVNEQAA